MQKLISRSIIAAINVLDFKYTFSHYLYYKTREKACHKKLAGEQQKILPPLRSQISKPTANQAFYNAPSKMVLDSQLQNKVTTLELQVFEAKKAVV